MAGYGTPHFEFTDKNKSPSEMDVLNLWKRNPYKNVSQLFTPSCLYESQDYVGCKKRLVKKIDNIYILCREATKRVLLQADMGTYIRGILYGKHLPGVHLRVTINYNVCTAKDRTITAVSDACSTPGNRVSTPRVPPSQKQKRQMPFNVVYERLFIQKFEDRGIKMTKGETILWASYTKCDFIWSHKTRIKVHSTLVMSAVKHDLLWIHLMELEWRSRLVNL